MTPTRILLALALVAAAVLGVQDGADT